MTGVEARLPASGALSFACDPVAIGVDVPGVLRLGVAIGTVTGRVGVGAPAEPRIQA
jgi:hypothetical protein